MKHALIFIVTLLVFIMAMPCKGQNGDTIRHEWLTHDKQPLDTCLEIDEYVVSPSQAGAGLDSLMRKLAESKYCHVFLIEGGATKVIPQPMLHVFATGADRIFAQRGHVCGVVQVGDSATKCQFYLMDEEGLDEGIKSTLFEKTGKKCAVSFRKQYVPAGTLILWPDASTLFYAKIDGKKIEPLYLELDSKIVFYDKAFKAKVQNSNK